jgi:hypothetical protein
MPLGEIAGEVIAGILRVIGQFVLELVLEILIKGPGYVIVRALRRRKDIDPEGAVVILVGILFWVVLVVGGYVAYRYVAAAGA